MKVLRVFFTKFYNFRRVENPHLGPMGQDEGRYSRKRESADFAHDLDHAKVTELIYKEHGMPPELQDSKYPPNGFARIHSFAVVENDPPRAKLAGWTATERDLLTGEQLRAALSDSPRMMARRR